MKFYGIDGRGDVLVERVTTKPVWDSSYEGRLIYAQDDDELYFGVAADWKRTGDIPTGETILFEKDTVVAGYTLQTDQDDQVVYITKGSAAGGEAGASGYTGSTWTQPDHGHTVDGHTHTVNSHDHTIGAHNHSMQSHTHTGPSHAHTYSTVISHRHTYGWSPGSGYERQGGTPVMGGQNYSSFSDTTDYTGSASGTTAAAGTGATGEPSTVNTGSGGTGATGAAGTGNTGTPSTANTSSDALTTSSDALTSNSTSPGTDSTATVNTWRPSGRCFTRQQRN